jgi:hypothetical protein
VSQRKAGKKENKNMANKFTCASDVVAHAKLVLGGEREFSMKEDEKLAVARGKFASSFNVKEIILLQQYDSFVFPMITEAHNREARRHKLW